MVSLSGNCFPFHSHSSCDGSNLSLPCEIIFFASSKLLFISFFRSWTLILSIKTFIDNQLLEFSTVEYPDASLSFNVRNTSSETIGMRIEVESISGTDGSMMELCFGECYFGVSSGTSYPTSPSMPNVNIEASQTQPSSGDHFFNMDAGDGNTPVEYVFKFYLADENGIQDGNSLRLRYRYTQN